ncbi:mannitol operon transcriptional antiterminator [Paenibacillus castaneae]|uniref:BglG family transcription antiterminator n=1 Tax=Paenibacillus castaneae TaxID=474957 RepID=UPI000C9C0270|nr:BglG family transcription antiterminator [Paenibacillus castaneae]NIK78199.1 mannitol operon transcriptional antiterminator [Paenibacillus castaneae]
MERFKQSFDRSRSFEYTADERKIIALSRLLQHDEPIKLFTLAHELRVTMPTISHDLDELEETLVKQGLNLVRRRGYGIEINGPEEAKRHYISLLALNHLDDSDLFGQFKNMAVTNPATAQLLGMIGKENFKMLEQALWELNDDWPNILSESDYTRMLIKLSVALTRIEQGNMVSASDYNKGDEIPLLKELLDVLGIQLLIEERRYLSQLLDNEAFPESSLLIHHDDMPTIEGVRQLIHYVEKQLRMSLMEDRSLEEGLIQHIKPAFQRIKEGLAIRNPMLGPIKKDYGPLFSIVRNGVQEIYHSLKVPDEEIGYLVMHFGASLERLQPFPRKIRAVLVCTSGIGSSKLLAVKIAKELPQIDLIGHYSWYEATRLPPSRYDLIISTVELPLDPDRYIKLSPMLTPEETNKLRAYIEGTTLKKVIPATTTETEVSGQSPMERLLQLQHYSGVVLRLLDGFRVHDLKLMQNQERLENQLPSMLSLLSKPYIDSNREKITELLLAREQQGSVIIPDTQLALIHTRCEWIEEPLLALYRYDRPLLLSEDGEDQAMQLLMMLGPLKLDSYSLELLSEISAMLLLPDLLALLAHGHAASIKLFISQKLEHYIKTKLDWRES